eukprot:1161959-Pelagomonas_calceolata.AAC.4
MELGRVSKCAVEKEGVSVAGMRGKEGAEFGAVEQGGEVECWAQLFGERRKLRVGRGCQRESNGRSGKGKVRVAKLYLPVRAAWLKQKRWSWSKAGDDTAGVGQFHMYMPYSSAFLQGKGGQCGI